MEQRHEIYKITLTQETMHTIGTLHTHLKEVDSRISNFETSMTTLKYFDNSHMSKLERDIAILQDHLKTHEKESTWAYKL